MGDSTRGVGTGTHTCMAAKRDWSKYNKPGDRHGDSVQVKFRVASKAARTRLAKAAKADGAESLNDWLHDLAKARARKVLGDE